MFRKFALGALFGCLAAFSFGQQSYTQNSSQVRIGQLLLASDGYTDRTPDLLLNIAADSSIVPPSWNFVNPNHGADLVKSSSNYWEVNIDNLSDTAAANYDVLVISAHGYIDLNPTERARLQRFMDSGGILWIDLSSSSFLGDASAADISNGFPLGFKGGSGSPSFFADYLHPILNSPNDLTYIDLNAMPGPNPFAAGIAPIYPGDLTTPELGEEIPGDSQRLQTIMGGFGNEEISVGEVGDGYEVITCNDMTDTINNVTLGLPQPTGYTDGAQSAIKLAVNILSLANQSGQQGAGAHKSGSNRSSAQAPLEQEWNDSTNGVGGYAPSGTYGYSPASSFHGYVAISQNGQLLVYDGHPEEDVTGEGKADNGEADYEDGKPYDLVWKASVSGPISPPTCIEVPVPTGSGTNIPTDEVWIEDGTGNVDGYDLASGHLIISVAGPSPDGSAAPDTSVDQPGPYAPTFQDGLLFIADNVGTPPVGRVWIVDPVAGAALTSSSISSNSPWQVEGTTTGAQNALPELNGPATVGYIPKGDGSGGVDRVVYVPTLPQSTGALAGAGVYSFWLGSRGELVSPSNINTGGGNLTITTDAAQTGAQIFVPVPGDSPAVLAMGPRLTVLDATGTPLNESQMQAIFGDQEPDNTSPGILVYTMAGSLPIGYSIRIDYSLSWGSGNPLASSQLERGFVTFPDSGSSPNHRILDHLVLGSTGIIYAVTSTQDASGGGGTNENGGGDFWELQEASKGQFNVLVRWSLYDQHTMTVNGTDNTVLPTVSNQDPLLQLLPGWGSTTPFYTGQMQYLTFTSGPVLSGNTVYCMAQAFTNQSTPTPDTILLAFKAVPDTPVLQVNSYAQGASITQPNITASPVKSAPTTTTLYQGSAGGIVATAEPNGNWSLRFSSLSTSTSGALNSCLSLSQPIDYSDGGGTNGTDQFIYPDTVSGDHWSPLSWFMVFTNTGLSQTAVTSQAVGPPYVSSDTVYVPMVNEWAGPRALIYGIKSTIAANDAFFVPDQHSWQNQLTTIQAPVGSPLSLTSLSVNPDLLWPHISDVNSFATFQLRANQASLQPVSGTYDSSIYGLVGGNSRLFAWTNTALYGFERPDYVIADSGRVSDLDAVGDPIWSTDQSLSTSNSNQGQIGNVHTLVNPVRAYPLENGQTCVVDAGGNRIALLDNSGHEIRTIDSFALDPNYTPDGYISGETLKLSSPHDITSYTDLVTSTSGQNPFSSPQATEYWVHYIIADSGNRRLLDIVDRYTYDNSTGVGMVGQPIALGVLYWHSPESLSGGKYSYTCVTLGNSPAGTNQFLAAGIGNVAPAQISGAQSAGTSTSTGAIVVFPSGTAQPGAGYIAPYLFDDLTIPAVTTPDLYIEGTTELNGTFSPGNSSVGVTRQMGSLNSLTTLYTGGQATLMFTDSSGVYELNSTTLLSGSWSLDWMLPRSLPVSAGVVAPIYSVMRQAGGSPTTSNPLDFRPTYAERLPSGNIMIVNGYVGRYRKANPTDPDVTFKGEILEIDGTVYNLTSPNLGFTGNAILYQVPPINGTRELSVPVFATRR